MVRGGKPVATIATDARPKPAGKGRKAPAENAQDEVQAVQLLVEWVKKITEAELPVAQNGINPAVRKETIRFFHKLAHFSLAVLGLFGYPNASIDVFSFFGEAL
jgi:hypothetical protein